LCLLQTKFNAFRARLSVHPSRARIVKIEPSADKALVNHMHDCSYAVFVVRNARLQTENCGAHCENLPGGLGIGFARLGASGDGGKT
jgi:hypothetical protein